MVGRTDAHRIVDHYEKINNRAGETRDAELAATVGEGTLFQRSSATFRQVRSRGLGSPQSPVRGRGGFVRRAGDGRLGALLSRP
ncbi:hypothetical protein [Streptomyces sp. SYP-A7185]|uniref:hypothetical protein n=1 Tax=Streptomyces sp. SYP-A7185 TaxID=3040076 RepID=UPI0038F7173F